MIKRYVPLMLCAMLAYTSVFAQSPSKKNDQVKTAENIDKTSKSESDPVMILLSTDYGDMKIMLYNETPQHRDNFVKLVNEGYYDDLLFHRIISNFMIQGGDPDSRGADPGKRLGVGGPSYTIPAEFNTAFIHKKGALAAARQGDQVNPEKRSSGSQFYIVQGNPVQDDMLTMVENRGNFKYTDEQREAYRTLGGTPHLDQGYTVFGEVVEGLDVIDKIAAVQTGTADRPVKDISMKLKVIK